VKFWEAYSVLLTVADSALANAARTYAYRLQEARESLRSKSVMPPDRFDRVTPLIRKGRHATINAMRVELGLEKTSWPKAETVVDAGEGVLTPVREAYPQGRAIRRHHLGSPA
jgi:hypothetical protein